MPPSGVNASQLVSEDREACILAGENAPGMTLVWYDFHPKKLVANRRPFGNFSLFLGKLSISCTDTGNQMTKPLKVIRTLGSGLKSVVYVAEDTVLRRQIAIKIIKPEYDRDQAAEKHAIALAQVPRHENVVQIYSVQRRVLEGFISGEEMVIEMELIDGVSIASLLHQTHFTGAQVKTICSGICDGLQFMHEHGVAHSDLHAANVLVNSLDVPVIIDVDVKDRATISRSTSFELAHQKSADLDAAKFITRLVLKHSMVPAEISHAIMSALDNCQSFDEVKAALTIEVASPKYEKMKSIDAVKHFEEGHFVTLRNVAIEHAKKLCSLIDDDQHFPMWMEEVSKEKFVSRLEEIESISMDSCEIASAIGAWSNNDDTSKIVTDMLWILSHFSASPYMKGTFQQVWNECRWYPTLLMFYGISFTCYRNGRFALLREVLDLQVQPNSYSFLEEINLATIELENTWKSIMKSNRFTPITERIASIMDRIAPAFSLNQTILNDEFDELQCFLSCLIIYANRKLGDSDLSRRSVLKGRYLWRLVARGESAFDATTRLLRKAEKLGPNWKPLQAGFFDGKSTDAIASLKESVQLHSKAREAYRMY